MNRLLTVAGVAFAGGALVSFGGWFAPLAAAHGAPEAPPQMPTELARTAWRLVEFQSMDDAIGTRTPDDPSVYTMRLDADGNVSMRLNCNRATGTWSAQASADGTGGTFSFGPLAVTRALCPPPSMDEQIARDSQYVTSYLLRDGRLYLSLMADAGIYAWEPDPAGIYLSGVPAAPYDGGPRAFEVTGGPEVSLRGEPSATAEVATSYATGTILNNLDGCRAAEDGVWCYVQEVGGGPVGFVSTEFLQGAVSPNGAVATGPDDSALRAGRGDFDATGNIPCSETPGQPTTQCSFSVARAGGGYATVVVTRPSGDARVIYFQLGIPIGFSSAEADGSAGLQFSATKESDVSLVRIGEERYEIPDAVVLGG